jgi:uncharacterized protein
MDQKNLKEPIYQPVIKSERLQSMDILRGVWLFQIIASPIWLKYFRFGPLEWVWRSLTYWQRQPMIIK